MKGLIKLLIGLAIVASSFLLISFIAWLLTDADYTFKQCVQSPPVFILAIIANLFYFSEED